MYPLKLSKEEVPRVTFTYHRFLFSESDPSVSGLVPEISVPFSQIGVRNVPESQVFKNKGDQIKQVSICLSLISNNPGAHRWDTTNTRKNRDLKK